MLKPATGIDHVLMAVEDLASGASDLERRHGLIALEGGRHPGAGTANMIVPLGGDYLELIACVDAGEAAGNPLSRRVTDALARGSHFATWAVRVPDLDAVSARIHDLGLTGIGPRQGSRLRPDGVLLEWRTLHVGDGLEPAVPFFIEWKLDPADYPGAAPVEHPAGRVEMRGLRITSPRPRELLEQIRSLADADLPLHISHGESEEITGVVLSVDGREKLVQ